MSQENVEVLRRGYEAFNRGDRDAAMSLMDPGIEVYPDPAALGGEDRGVWHGREGYLAFIKNWMEPWEEYRVEPREFIDAGDRVLVFTDNFGRRPGSGFEVKLEIAQLWTIRDRAAVRVQFYLDRGKALEAAGLTA